MREQEFRQWLQNWTTPRGGQLEQGNLNFYINSANSVEQVENLDLDEEFQRDRMASLYQLYTYSTQDEQNDLPNPTNMPITTRLYTALSDIRSALNHYKRFCEAGDDFVYEVRENNNASDTNANATFGLEKDLQAALRKHIDQLEAGLKIVDGESERSVDSGRIDILAKDSNGTFVIIELKAGTATDSVVAQILGYMGDIAEEENVAVRGIIVASDFNKRVQSASRATSNLELKTYRYNFEFN